jgi:hypothetical protein
LNSLATFLNQNAPDLKTELLPLFKEHFDLSEEEIINNLLTMNREKGADARKLNLLGFINSQSQEIPSVFFKNLPSQGLHASLLGLNCSLKVENIHLLNIRMKKFIARFFREHDIPISPKSLFINLWALKSGPSFVIKRGSIWPEKMIKLRLKEIS